MNISLYWTIEWNNHLIKRNLKLHHFGLITFYEKRKLQGFGSNKLYIDIQVSFSIKCQRTFTQKS